MLQHPVPPALLVHIGDITVSFALLENTLQSLAWFLLNDHQRIGQIITAELSFKNLRALIISLYLERSGRNEDFDVLRKLMSRAKKIEDERNLITHSIWGAGSAANKIVRIKTTAKESSGIKFHFLEMDDNELRAIADEIKSLSEEISDFRFFLAENSKK